MLLLRSKHNLDACCRNTRGKAYETHAGPAGVCTVRYMALLATVSVIVCYGTRKKVTGLVKYRKKNATRRSVTFYKLY